MNWTNNYYEQYNYISSKPEKWVRNQEIKWKSVRNLAVLCHSLCRTSSILPPRNSALYKLEKPLSTNQNGVY